MFENCKYLVVGAGMWGAVLAERLASRYSGPVVVIDRRAHSGGNCHSRVHAQTGVEAHVYGTHIFHTRRPRVWEYLNGFCSFNSYRHRVLTEYRGRVYSMPINLATINAFYNLTLKPFEAAEFIRQEAARENIAAPANLEEQAVSQIGRPLYEAFIKGYTRKQWDRDPAELPASIINRLPVRLNYNQDYFDDPWQGLPLAGYAGLFDKLLAAAGIVPRLGVDYKDVAERIPPDCRVFYSGAIDEFFAYRLGRLEWRGLRFEEEVVACPDFQGASVINQADETTPFTRTHEFKHLHPERRLQSENTLIVREYPQTCGPDSEPYYPVNSPANQKLLADYQALAARETPNVTFGGRLGSYRYLDMDATVESALELADGI